MKVKMMRSLNRDEYTQAHDERRALRRRLEQAEIVIRLWDDVMRAFKEDGTRTDTISAIDVFTDGTVYAKRDPTLPPLSMRNGVGHGALTNKGAAGGSP